MQPWKFSIIDIHTWYMHRYKRFLHNTVSTLLVRVMYRDNFIQPSSDQLLSTEHRPRPRRRARWQQMCQKCQQHLVLIATTARSPYPKSTKEAVSMCKLKTSKMIKIPFSCRWWWRRRRSLIVVASIQINIISQSSASVASPPIDIILHTNRGVTRIMPGALLAYQHQIQVSIYISQTVAVVDNIPVTLVTLVQRPDHQFLMY